MAFADQRAARKKKGLAYAAPGSEISTWPQMNRFLPDVIPIVDLGLLYAGSATEMLDPISRLLMNQMSNS